ncbi:MAG: hypothetical protein L3J02_01875 [Henriciella sp.]|nr:hypothetical protein [Henriciella sp.]
MTTTPPTERDITGRFIKPEADEPATPAHDNDMHPLARLLFGWVESPRTPLFLLIAVVTVCAGLIGVDLILDRHEYIEEANMIGFYALWGFGSFALAVLSGWPLSKLLRRSEDYYGEADTTPQDVEADQ